MVGRKVGDREHGVCSSRGRSIRILNGGTSNWPLLHVLERRALALDLVVVGHLDQIEADRPR